MKKLLIIASLCLTFLTAAPTHAADTTPAQQYAETLTMLVFAVANCDSKQFDIIDGSMDRYADARGVDPTVVAAQFNAAILAASNQPYDRSKINPAISAAVFKTVSYLQKLYAEDKSLACNTLAISLTALNITRDRQ
jgi:hypothetical protein